MKMKRDIELLYEIGCLRFIQRNWRQFLNADFANETEHIFRVTWIAMVLSKMEKKGDLGKITQMALIHDLGESRSGDVHYISRLYTVRNEVQAMKDIIGGTILEKDLLKLYSEYEERDSIESKIVKDADNLDVDFELQEQEERGQTLIKKWKQMRIQVYNQLYTNSAKKLWKSVQSSSPHSWHLNAKNRFTQGDWKKK